tara:strand:+ start:2192 stop:2827 length:636 start_codon:yes stop_codon:yes gene_type:complete
VKKHILVLDYGVGNIKSILAAFKKFDDMVILGSATSDFQNAKALIIPGVGAFQHGMNRLIDRNLDKQIKNFASLNKPILGICLGMQMLFSTSEEFGMSNGLNLISGSVKKLQPNTSHKLPNISWSRINLGNKKETFFNGIEESDSFYHIHSFYAQPDEISHVIANTTFHDQVYCSVVKKGNIFGCQFHPEKSSGQGLKIISNFVGISNKNE